MTRVAAAEVYSASRGSYTRILAGSAIESLPRRFCFFSSGSVLARVARIEAVPVAEGEG